MEVLAFRLFGPTWMSGLAEPRMDVIVNVCLCFVLRADAKKQWP